MNNITTIIILVSCYLALPKIGYTWNGALVGHLAYSFCHANVFHLLCNCLVLFMLKQSVRIEMFVIAILCSFIPCWGDETVGASGVIFAHIGWTWGKTGRFLEMCKKNIPFVVLFGLLPNMNMMIHFYCMMAGYLYGLQKGGLYVR